MPYSALPKAEFGRRQIRDIIVGRPPRTADIQAVITAIVAQWGLVAIPAASFGFLNNPAGDSQVAVAAGNNVMTSPGNPWAVTDVGKEIHVQGAGAAGVTLVTTIAGYTNPGQITLGTNAITAVTGTDTATNGLAVWGTPATITLPAASQRVQNTDGSIDQIASGAVGALSLGTVLPAGGTATRTLAALFGEDVNARDFGAVGDFVANDTAALQAAITYAAANGKELFIPAGTYKITAPLNIPNTGNLRIYGAGKTLTILKGSGVFASIFNIGDLLAQTIRGCFQDLQCNGIGATVQYGIYGTRVEEHDFVRVACFGFATAGFSIGFGYVINYLQCEASYCTGNGFETNIVYGTGGNNALVYRDCLALAIDGWGIRVTHGYNVEIAGCTIEQCKKGGVWLNFVPGVRIQGYFEGNGLNGHTFTAPAVTVKADIVLNGSGTDTDMDASYPCTGVVIEGCITAPRVTSNAFVWNAGGVDISIKGCFTNQPTWVPALVEHYRDAYKGQNVMVDGCSSFTTQVSEFGASAGINNNFSARIKIHNPSLAIGMRNYAVTDHNAWTNIAAGSAVTYRRSQTASLYNLKGTNVWELASTAAGTSGAYGFSVTATDYPELVGKTVWFGIWLYCTDAACYAVPYCNQQTFNSNPTTLATWTFLAVSFTWPGAGTVDLGVYKTGANTGSVFCAAPMLTPIGFPHTELIGLIPTYQQWKGTAAPAAGTWARGDRIAQAQPTVGSPKGWLCTVAGTPGTWVSEGNL